MNGVTTFFKSKTIWGLIVTAIGLVMGFFGLTFSEADQGIVLANIDKIIEAAGVLIATWGRITATKQITGVFKSG